MAIIVCLFVIVFWVGEAIWLVGKNCEIFYVDLDLVVRSGISNINLPYNIIIRLLWNLSRTRYFEA